MPVPRILLATWLFALSLAAGPGSLEPTVRTQIQGEGH